MKALEKQREYYEERFNRFGDSPQGLDWSNAETQQLRFARILDAIQPTRSDSLLDVGCGTAALFSYLKAKGIEPQ